jgi:hypothetical protein
MFVFEPNTNNTYDLVEVSEPNASGDVERIYCCKRLEESDLGEIVLAAVSVINPAMGDMMRSMMQ